MPYVQSILSKINILTGVARLCERVKRFLILLLSIEALTKLRVLGRGQGARHDQSQGLSCRQKKYFGTRRQERHGWCSVRAGQMSESSSLRQQLDPGIALVFA
jgi:hypothetical protein